MKIDYFLKNYQYGKCFFPISREDITKSVKKLDWKSYYVYLLCIDNEIVYVGYSGVIRERLKLHRRHICFDTVYVAEIEESKDINDLEDILELESEVINFTNPILNQSEKFTVYEKYNKNGAKPLDFILGYIECINKFDIA